MKRFRADISEERGSAWAGRAKTPRPEGGEPIEVGSN